MYKTKTVYCFDGEHAFCDVEPRNILRERVIFNEHAHQIAAWQEFHDEIQVGRILERIKKLDNPGGVWLGEDISFRSNVRQLSIWVTKWVETVYSICGYIPDLSSTSHPSSRSSWHKSFRCQPFGPVEPTSCMDRPSLRSELVITSPNAPLPITLSVLKSCRPSFVLRSRRNVDSFFPRWCICRCFLSSDTAPSPCSRRSRSTRLYSYNALSW